MNIAHYTKAIPPLLLSLVTAGLMAAQGVLDQQPLIAGLSIGGSIVTAFLTFRVANDPDSSNPFLRAAKAWAQVLNVGVQSTLAVVTTVNGDLHTVAASQWLIVAVAIIGALSTYVFPNEPELVIDPSVVGNVTTKMYVVDGSGDGLVPDPMTGGASPRAPGEPDIDPALDTE